MQDIATVIIGAGQSGLAMSHQLKQHAIEHVLLERGKVANSWRTERWDSLRLLTPNWQSRLPGYCYDGSDPHGFRTMPEVVAFLDQYAQQTAAPVQDNTNVTCVQAHGNGYRVVTDRGVWQCRSVVLASGACNIASIPKIAASIPAAVHTLTSLHYRNPEQLPDGEVLVVGASATGIQLAREIQASGRQVTLSVGEHVRLPRIYRGRDIKWWMDAIGVLDMHYRDADDIRRARRVPSPQLVGTPERRSLDLNALSDIGVEIVGRFAGINDGRAQFSGALANHCASADLKMNRLLQTIDDWIAAHGVEQHVDDPDRPEATRVPVNPRLAIDFNQEKPSAVIWATGYRPDYSWLEVPVLDRFGNLRHDGGVVDAPGMYVMGLPFLRRRKSSLIDGAADDARDLSAHLAQQRYGWQAAA